MPKRKSKTDAVKDAPEPETPEEQVEEEPFSELRYKAPPPAGPGPEYHPKLVRVAVAKTKKFWRLSDIRSFSGQPNDSKDNMTVSSLIASTASTKSPRSWAQGYLKDKDSANAEHASLSESAIQPPRLTLCSNPIQEKLAPRLSTYIRNPRHCSELFDIELAANAKREAKCLERHKKAKQVQLRQENEMIKKSGKNRDTLMLRRNQVMPQITSKGLEKTIIPVQRAQTPTKFPDWVLWAPVIYDIKEKNGISPQRQKYQQGYDVVTDWVGHPEITDELRKELGLNEEHAMSAIVQNASEEVCTEQIDCLCVPKMERLGVLGFSYNRLQHVLRQPIRKLVVLDKENQAPGGLNSSASLPTLENHETFDPSKKRSSTVSLILGNVHLNWSTDPQNTNKTRVVELGCSAEPNKHSIDYVLMRNTGTTVIRFNWVKKIEGDGFHKHRLGGQMRMIFDYQGGIILPGEVYRIPFMYKALTPGQFCQDWKLLTQPVLENGAEIILRLWGFTRLSDKQLSTRERIEDKLRQRRVTTIAKNILEKIVKSLPIGQSSLDEVLLPYPQLNGPDIFISKNPWLYYNSYHVDRLGRITALIMNELRKQHKSAVSITNLYRDEEPSLLSGDDGDIGGKSPDSSGSLIINEESPVSQTEVAKDSSSEEEFDSESIGLSESLSEELMILRKELIESTPKMAVAKSNGSQKKDKNKAASTEELTSVNSGMSMKDTSSTQESVKKNRPEASAKQAQSVINMIDPNIVVHSIRQNLLQMRTNHIRQDALFTLMTEEISSLLFKPFYPCDNWKIPVLKGLFSKAIEEFETFASQLETSCYEAEHLVQDKKKLEEDQNRQSSASSDNTSGDETMTVNEKQPVLAEEPNTSRSEKASVLAEEIESSLPRYDLEPERYKDHYYGRLYSTMYWLLSDMVDEMDTLIYQPPRVDPRYGKAVFIKIDKVPLNVHIESELEKPLPPKWVNILHKMNTIRRQFFTSDTKIAHSDISGTQE